MSSFEDLHGGLHKVVVLPHLITKTQGANRWSWTHEPVAEVIKWLDDHKFVRYTDWDWSMVAMATSQEFYFRDAVHAMLFKLAWGGR